MLPDQNKVAAIIRETASIEILPLFRKLKDHQIDDKESGEIVTAADINAEQRLTAALEKLAPGSTTVGEEAVSENPEILDRLAGDRAVWVIDPVDTKFCQW